MREKKTLCEFDVDSANLNVSYIVFREIFLLVLYMTIEKYILFTERSDWLTLDWFFIIE